jgi:hypothetical protein
VKYKVVWRVEWVKTDGVWSSAKHSVDLEKSGPANSLGVFQKLKDFRGYFVVLAFIIAAVITPPDVVSQLALAIPMCLLYEVGIWAAQIFIRKTQPPEAEAQNP